jgi:Bacterial protein of unknown function (DUF899)
VNVVGHDEWLRARKELLDREKEFTRARDELTSERQSLPWEAVEKEYVFRGPRGEETLADLFDGRSQLVVYHFMARTSPSTTTERCLHAMMSGKASASSPAATVRSSIRTPPTHAGSTSSTPRTTTSTSSPRVETRAVEASTGCGVTTSIDVVG